MTSAEYLSVNEKESSFGKFVRKYNPMRGRHLRPSLKGPAKVLGGAVFAAGLGLGVQSNLDKSSGEIVSQPPVSNINSGVIIEPVAKTQESLFDYRTITEKVMDKVPMNLKEQAAVSIPLIAEALRGENITDPNVIGFILATAEYETHFEYNKEEFQGEAQAKKLGYSGGERFYARGLSSLTHDYNYDKYGKRLGIDLLNNPDLALARQYTGKILVAFVKDEGIVDKVTQGDYEGARKIFVGDYADTDEYNKQITEYITERSKSYAAALTQ